MSVVAVRASSVGLITILMAEQPLPRFFLALMIIAMVLLGLVVMPVAKELFLAAVFAGVLWPVQQWLSKHLRGKRGVAAGSSRWRSS